MKSFIASCVIALAAITCLAQQETSAVPAEVLSAKSIGVFVYWPGATFNDIAAVRADALAFLRKWKRYEVISDPSKADLIATVIVQPTKASLGFWRSLALGMALGAQQMGANMQNSQPCTGTATTYGNTTDVQLNCPPRASVPTIRADAIQGQSVLGGTLMLYDGKAVRSLGQDARPLLVQSAEHERGSRPLIGAGKKLTKLIDAAFTTKPSAISRPEPENEFGLQVFNNFVAHVHSLATQQGYSEKQFNALLNAMAKMVGGNQLVLGRIAIGEWTEVDQMFETIRGTQKP